MKPITSLLVPKEGAPSKTFNDVECGLIEKGEWAKGKSALLPWAFLDAYNPFDQYKDEQDKPVRFYSCRADLRCKQFWEVPEKGVGEIQSNMSRHIQRHFASTELLGGDQVKKETKPQSSQYEFVARWLASGLPHYQVTRETPSGLYSFLKSSGCPVSTKKTFDAHLEMFLVASVSNMQKALKSQVGFIMGDSSPDRLKREWISWGVSFINRDTATFHYMPLGLIQAKGRLTADAYGQHHDTLVKAWEMKECFKADKAAIDRVGGFSIVGGGADMGPGLRQVYQVKFGVPNLHHGEVDLDGKSLVMFGPCASHGVVNIQKAALELGGSDGNNSCKDYLEELTELIKLLQNRSTLENLQDAVGITFPSTFRSKKWTSLKQTIHFFVGNWHKLFSLKGTNLDIVIDDEEDDKVVGMGDEAYSSGSEDDEPVPSAQYKAQTRWNWDSTFEMLSVFDAVMEPLCTLSVTLQVVGPLDGYVMVLEVVSALSALHNEDFLFPKLVEKTSDDGLETQEVERVKMQVQDLTGDRQEVYQAMKPAIELMKKRLVRRFFFNSIGCKIGRIFVPEDSAGDQTVKFDYLQCTCVLSLFALSSISDFKIFEQYGVATTQETRALEIRAENALWELCKLIKGEGKGTEVAKEIVRNGRLNTVKRARPDNHTNGRSEQRSEDSLRKTFFASVSSLTSKPELKEAELEFDNSPKQRDDRDRLFRRWLKLADSVDSTLGDLLCICGAQMFSNAAGESNFSSVTRILSDSRLRTGVNLLAAQILAIRAKTWAQFDDPGKNPIGKTRKNAIAEGVGLWKYHNVAAKSVGHTTSMEVEEVEEVKKAVDNEEVAPQSEDPEHDASISESPGQDTSPKQTQDKLGSSESEVPQQKRLGKGSKMEAIIRTIYGKSKGALTNKKNREPHEEEEDDDEEFTI